MNNIAKFGLPEKQGLYDPAFEKDACGVGFVAHIKGQRSHQIVLDANEIMMNMEHRVVVKPIQVTVPECSLISL